jgi:hypothetical protein
MSRFFRKGPKSLYTAKHVARCEACRGETEFWRHPNDRNARKRGHFKYLHCYTCRRSTLHLQQGAE